MHPVRAPLSIGVLTGALAWSGPAAPQDRRAEDKGPIDQVDGDAELVLPDERVLDEIAAERIVELYGVDLDDARRQMELQEPAADATTALMESIPVELQGGFHIDRRNGGTLVVSVTDEVAVDVEAFEVPIEVRRVANSTAELRALSEEIYGALGDPEELSPAVDAESNTVVLRPYAPAGPAGRELAEQMVEAHGRSKVSIGRTFESRPEARPCSPTSVYCSRPLRGGVTYIDTPFIGWCTLGFIVESIYDAKRYALTAGHCAYMGFEEVFRTRQYPSEAIRQIGPFWSWYWNSVTDSGIIQIADLDPTTGWRPNPWVNVKASGATTANAAYPINAVGASGAVPQNYLLCTTVTSAGTGCGPLVAVGVGSNPGNKGEVDIVTCKGDSGAPFYKQNKGFGILQGGNNQTVNSVNPLNLGPMGGVKCGAPTYYVGLATAMGPLNVQLP